MLSYHKELSRESNNDIFEISYNFGNVVIIDAKNNELRMFRDVTLALKYIIEKQPNSVHIPMHRDRYAGKIYYQKYENRVVGEYDECSEYIAKRLNMTHISKIYNDYYESFWELNADGKVLPTTCKNWYDKYKGRNENCCV